MAARAPLALVVVVLALLFPSLVAALPGDLDDSGRVDGYDLILFARAQGATDTDPNWLAKADLDENGTIDQDDLAILTAHFGRTGAAFGLWAAAYDTGANRVLRLADDGTVLGRTPDFSPTHLAVDPTTGMVWAASSSAIVLFDPSGATIQKTITGVNAGGLAVDPQRHRLWVSDPGNSRLLVFDAALPATYDMASDTGHHRAINGITGPRRLDVDSRADIVWVMNNRNELIRLRGDAPDGYDLTSDSGYHRLISGYNSYAIPRVNQGDSTLWLLDPGRATLYHLDATGRTLLFSLPGLTGATDLAVNPMDGSVTVTGGTSINGQVTRVAADGALLYRLDTLPGQPAAVVINPLDGSSWISLPSPDLLMHLAANGTELLRLDTLDLRGPLALVPWGGDLARFPIAAALADRTNVDVGQTVTFTGIGSDPDGTIVRYQWDFDGDGTFDYDDPATGVTTHAYGATGIYTPIFRVTDNHRLTATDQRLVIRVGRLTVQATSDVTSGPAALTVNFDGRFTDPIDGRVDSFQWDFDGDGLFDSYDETTAAASHTYDRAGTYTAILKVTDGPHSATDTLTITVTKAPPQVSVSATPASGTAPLAVVLDGNATDPDGTVVLYQWDFDGDGTQDWSSTTTPQVPYRYVTAGSYTPQLTVTDNDGNTASATTTVTVNGPLPTAAAGATPLSGHPPLAVQFSAAGSTAPGSSISRYQWDFDGDGTFDYDDPATGDTSHTYTTAGTYQARLQVTNAEGQTAEATVTVTVIAAGEPLVSLTATPATGTVPLAVTFTPTTSGDPITAYAYDFGDTFLWGADSTTAHRLDTVDGTDLATTPGFSTIMDIAAAPDGTLWLTDSTRLAHLAADGTVLTSWTFTSPGQVVVDETDGTLWLTSRSAPYPLWHLRDDGMLLGSYSGLGSSASEMVLDNGVLWIAVDGNDRVIRLDTAAPPGYDLSGASGPHHTSTSGINRPNDLAVDPADHSVWVTVYYDHLLLHLAADGSELGRIAGFSYPRRVAVVGDYVWVIHSSRSVERLDRATPGGYDLSSDSGHHQTVSGFSAPQELAADPVAGLVWLNDSGLDQVLALAPDTSVQRTFPAYNFSFLSLAGPGSHATATTGDPVDHTFTAPGNYRVHLTVTDSDGDTGTAQALVTVVEPPAVTLTGHPASGPAPLTVDFTTRVRDRDDTIARYQWDLDNDGTFETEAGTNQVVRHVYDAGSHTARVRVTDAAGHSTVASSTLTVSQSAPTVALLVSPVAGNAPLTVNGTATAEDSDGTITAYGWDFDNDTVTDGTTATATHTYTAAGTYPVTVTVTDDDGNSTTATTTVTVRPAGAPHPLLDLNRHRQAAGSPVRICGAGLDSDGTIAQSALDLDGDGSSDHTVAGPVTVFGDDFETDSGLWTFTGTWGRTTDDASSGSLAAADSPGGDYPDSSDTAMTSVAIDLSGAAAPLLTYRHRLALASSDYARVEISTNDGSSWSELQRFSNTTVPAWEYQEVDLRRYAGSTVRIRFRLSSNASTTADGWLVDDVFVGDCVVHAYPAAGDYPVSLTVTDDSGTSSTATALVHVRPANGGRRLWVTDTNNARVVELDELGRPLRAVYGFRTPLMTVQDPATGTIWVADSGNNRLVGLPASVQNGYNVDAVNVADHGPAGYGGVLRGEAAYGGGKINNGLTLDGSGNDYAEIADSAGLHPVSFTLEAWVNPAATATYNQVAGKVSQGKDFALMLHNGNPAALVYDNGRRWVESATPLPLNQWSHLAMTYDHASRQVILYVDGVEAARGTYTADTTNTDPFTIGKSLCCTEPFNGGIDEVRFWQTVRTPAEIQAAMNTALTGNEPGLVGYWPLDGPPAAATMVTGINSPHWIGIAPDTTLWVTAYNDNQVVHLAADGTELGRVDGFNRPRNLVVADDSSLWVTDTSHNQVVHLGADGTELVRVGGFSSPIGIDLHRGSNTVWVADYYNGRVVQLNAAGAVVQRVGGFNRPIGLAVDQADGSLWVTDEVADQAVHVTSAGLVDRRVTTVDAPQFPALDQTDGSLWLPDRYHHQVVHLSASGGEVGRFSGFNAPMHVSLLAAADLDPGLAPPQVTGTATPLAGDAPLAVTFSGSATDDGAVTGYSWDFDGDGTFDHDGVDASHTYLQPGLYRPVLRAMDDDGLAGYGRPATVVVGPAGIFATADPTSGTALLRVNFDGGVRSLAADRRIVRWAWDFDNDGIFDQELEAGPATTYTYRRAGSYTAVLRGIDSAGELHFARIVITVNNKPPVVSNYTSPTSGTAPLLVHLQGSARDDDGSITLYQWDYNGDGIFDWASTSQLDTWYSFGQAGTYDTLLRVTDDEGASSDAGRTVTVTTAQLPPAVTVSATPASGHAPLAVTFTATATDADGTIAGWSWDLDGDGTEDATDTPPLTHTYTTPGWYRGTVTVTDDSGLTASDVFFVQVLATGSPTAVLQVNPDHGPAPLEAVLDGSGSSDPDGTITEYQWALGRDTLWLGNRGNDRVNRYQYPAQDLTLSGYNPEDLARDPVTGDIWLSDSAGDQVVRLDPETGAVRATATGFYDPLGLAVNTIDHSTWVADYRHHQVVHLAADGSELARLDGFYYPTDVAVDPVDGSVWVTDTSHNQVVRLAADGTETARIYGFSAPQRLAMDPRDRSVWVSDRGQGRVVRLAADIPNGYDVNSEKLVATDHTGSGILALGRGDTGAATGVFAGGAALDGSGDYFLLLAHPALDVQDFTVEAWIQPTNTSGRAIYMRGNPSGGNEIYFGLYNNQQLDVVVDDQSFRCSGSTNLADGAFHHVALVFDQAAGTATCYVDGAVYGTPQGITATLDFGASHALIGADFDGYNTSLGNYFAGVIDEVRLWSRPLSAAEIASHNSAALAGNEAGLAAYFSLDTLAPTPYHLTVAGFGYPIALALDSQRSLLWVGDQNQDTVVGLDTATGRVVTRITGQDQATDLAVSPATGGLWVTDNRTNQAVLYTATGQLVARLAGLNDPAAILVLPETVVTTTTPTLAVTLPRPATYLVGLTVADDGANRDTATAVVTAGDQPRAVAIAYPSTGNAPLTVRFTSNADSPAATIENFQWDFDGNGTYDWSNPIPEVTDYTFQTPGVYQARLRVTDNKGRTAEDTVTITVTNAGGDLTASLAATPATGPAPLAVDFIGLAQTTGGFVTGYDFDLDGDGTFETSGTTPLASHTYATPGTYQAQLRVTDDNGRQALGSTVIQVIEAGSPVPAVTADPQSGPVSLDVTFTPSVTGTSTITDWAWDFDNDGTFDLHLAAPDPVVHTYHTPGRHVAVLQVTDDQGKTGRTQVTVTATAGLTAVLDRDQFDPSAGEEITISTALTGEATVTLRITDRSGHTLRTLVDGVSRPKGFYTDTWDGKDANGATVASGVYLFVVDYTVDGVTYHFDPTNDASTGVNKITPQYPTVFNPFSAATNFFRYTLGGKSEVTIYMSPFVGGAQTRARTLQLRSPRQAGSYVQTWDGTDDDGNLVRPMDYVIAVFAWPLPDNAIIVENRPVIGDLHVSPIALNPAAAPYDEVTSAAILFSLSKDATVTARILDEENFPVRRITVAGTAGADNRVTWDGTNEAGRLVAPGIYRVQLSAVDALGHRSQETNTVLIIFY